MTMTKRLLVATALAAALASAPAGAATFLFTFSGASFGNAAVATGSFDVTDAALAAMKTSPMADPYLSNLKLTVSGAAAGNGTFGSTAFATSFFHSPVAPDFSRELVGQSLGNGLTFGQTGKSGASGDFNIFGKVTGAPQGQNYFTLGAGGTSGNLMALTSLAVTAVPEPATWAMLILGFGLTGGILRYRKRMTNASFA